MKHEVRPSQATPPALLEAALALSEELLVATDAAGAIAWHNARFAAATGHDAAYLPGQLLLELLRSEHTDAGIHACMCAALASNSDFGPFEVQHRRADGTPFWNRIVARRIAADASPGAAGTAARFMFAMRDISAVRGLQRQTEHLGELLGRARELGHFAVWERDHDSGEGRWDKQMFRFFGLPHSEFPPPFDGVMARVHPEDRERVKRRIAMREPGHYSERYRIVWDDGSMRRVLSSWEVKAKRAGESDRSVGILVDETEIWQLAESADQAAARLRLAAELANIAIWRHDLRTDLVQYDESGLKVLDIAAPPEGIALAALRERVHPDDLAHVLKSAAASLHATGPTDVQARYRRSDGSYRTLLTRRVIERGANGEAIAFVGVALDITEQVASVRKATELAHRLETTCAEAGIGMWSLKLATRQTTWNAQVWKTMGLPQQEHPPLFDVWVDSVVHPDDREGVRRNAQSWATTNASVIESAFRVVHPDGSVHWIQSRARTEDGEEGRMIYGVTLDVTERREAQGALRDAYERAALTARGAGIGTWERDLRDQSSLWDEQMYRLRGLEPRRAVATNAERMASMHPDDRAAVDAQQLRVQKSRSGEPIAYEFRVVWPDGSVHWMASRAIGISDEKGELVRLIGVNWDITEAKSLEAERQEKTAAQRESKAKSQFLARMSHELRTPLNAVLGFTQLLQAEEDGSAPARSAKLQHIRTGGEHLLSLINEVLDLSSLESDQLNLTLAPLHLAGVVRESIALVEGQAREQGVTIEMGEMPGLVMADRTRLRQVLLNLLSNAIKYNRPQGRVSLLCSTLGTRVVLRVTDTGRGMTKEQLAHLFEPFNRLGVEREGIEGTGIGLVIVKVIVERMGGTLTVLSSPGKGSIFEVRLKSPESTTDPMALSAAMPLLSGSSAPVLRPGQLLYIEDNPVNTLLVKELVAQRPGLTLSCEADGRSGVTRAQALQPDLILVDMQLPDMDGHEVLRLLRAEPATASIPCIALSANVMTEDIERALAAGFSDYWTKPIDLPAFLSSLDALFGSAANTTL